VNRAHWLRVRTALLLLGTAAVLSSSSANADEPHFRGLVGAARPHRAYFDGGAVRIRYRFQAGRQVDVVVRIVLLGSGRVVRGFVDRGSAPGRTHRLRWGGRTWAGHPAPDGHYAVLAGRRGHSLRRIAGFLLHGHVFPVRGPHGTRGAIGEFGAPRSGGRTHEGFDVTAACGTRLVAARGGRVLRAGFDPVLYGWFVLVDGRSERRNYFYAHLRDRPRVHRGERVRTGEGIGSVGRTGNARSTPCHLHFELRRHGHPFDPEAALRRWDRWS
jgi:murein DD-endopeptidase MepM/ murein hydrolase activator NlpD